MKQWCGVAISVVASVVTSVVVSGVVSGVVLSARQVPATSPILGVGNFIHAVEDLDRSLAFYRDTLGLELQGPANPSANPGANAPPPAGPRPFIATPEILRLYDSAGGRYRVASTLVQGSPMRAELVEFTDLERKPAKRSLQDPGATTLILTVRDIDAAFTQAKFKGATVVTATEAPLAIADEHGFARAVLLQDPDGFFVQLVQRDTLPPASAPPGNVIAVGFGVTVDDMDRTVATFRDVLGFKTTLDPQDHDGARLQLMGNPDAFYRRTVAVVPGSSFEVEFLELHGLNRRQIRSRPRDPGSAILRLRVADIDATIATLDKAGVTVASAEGMPVTVAGAATTQRYAILRTPDHFFVQLVQVVP